MKIEKYNEVYKSYFASEKFLQQQKEAIDLLSGKKRIFFVGNGGSNSISSHMMEDFAKVARYETFSFSDPALITCFANDYGYENAIMEWCKIFLKEGDALVAISSSGNSNNILNAASYAASNKADVITLSGFQSTNDLVGLGKVNFHIPANDYGIVECFHQVVLHVILDELVALRSDGSE